MQYGSGPKAAAPSAPRLKVIPNQNAIAQVDGPSEEDKPNSKLDPPKFPPSSRPDSQSSSSLDHVGPKTESESNTATAPAATTTSPLVDERKPSPSTITSPRASRSTSPANPMGSRAGSPTAFGYPYHQPIQNGFLEHHTPTAIRG